MGFATSPSGKVGALISPVLAYIAASVVVGIVMGGGLGRATTVFAIAISLGACFPGWLVLRSLLALLGCREKIAFVLTGAANGTIALILVGAHDLGYWRLGVGVFVGALAGALTWGVEFSLRDGRASRWFSSGLVALSGALGGTLLLMMVQMTRGETLANVLDVAPNAFLVSLQAVPAWFAIRFILRSNRWRDHISCGIIASLTILLVEFSKGLWPMRVLHVLPSLVLGGVLHGIGFGVAAGLANRFASSKAERGRTN